MRRIKIIGLSMVSFAIVILASLSNVLGYQTVQSTNQYKINREVNRNNIITVDDEPGDADFTSINEALNHSNPGDTIEVYSGTYPEGTYPDDKIHIVKENISLLGISHELGEGDDSGKPYIVGNGSVTGTSIHVEASYVIVSNFHIKSGQIYLGTDNQSNSLRNITISDCIVHNSNGIGLVVKSTWLIRNIYVINNEISHCSYGIQVFSSINLNIKGNLITDIRYSGIYFVTGGENISYNIFKRCDIGILLLVGNNIIYRNDFEDCSIGISIPSWRGISIIENNFKNYRFFKPWFKTSFLDLFRTKDRWIGNYWDTWKGVGPKRIPGILILTIPMFEVGISIPIPWFAVDRQPAKEPYDIP